MLGFSLILLVGSGCSQGYSGERLFWKAKQLQTAILKNPSSATPEQFTKAIDAFGTVMEKTPGTVWAARAQMAAASLYVLQKDYTKARTAYALVLQNYNQYKDLCLAARFATAKSYEVEKQWEEAVKWYEEISDFHPWSPVGLEVPLYIARTYEQLQQPEAATKAYERAVRLYTKALPNAPTPALGTQAKGYLTLAYQRLGKWDDAIKTLEELALVSSEMANRPLVLLTLATIYHTKLGDPERAEAAYTKLLQEFPQHPFGKVAQAQLEHLGLPIPQPTPAP